MPILATFIQHSVESPSQDSQARERSKSHPNQEEINKTVTIADDMVLYVENPKDYTKKTVRINK